MKQIKTRKIVKEIKTFELHPEIESVTLQATYENSKLKDAGFEIKKQPLAGHTLWPVVVNSKFWELIKETNPWWEVQGKFGWSSGVTIETKDLVKLDQVEPENVVLTYSSGHLLFRLDMTPIPLPYGMDYIGTPNENTKIDLKGWLEDLKKNPMVINGEDLFIDEVPYYNNDCGTKKYIRGREIPWIVVLPDQETMNAIFALAMERRKEFFSVDMKDILFGDWLKWSLDQEKGTSHAAPIDPLNVRKYLKKHKDIDY